MKINNQPTSQIAFKGVYSENITPAFKKAMAFDLQWGNYKPEVVNKFQQTRQILSSIAKTLPDNQEIRVSGRDDGVPAASARFIMTLKEKRPDGKFNSILHVDDKMVKITEQFDKFLKKLPKAIAILADHSTTSNELKRKSVESLAVVEQILKPVG